MKKSKSNISYIVLLTLEILLAILITLFSIHNCRRNKLVHTINYVDSATVTANYMNYWGKRLPYENED